MDINQLKIFTTLTKEKNFSRTAKLYKLTQPAISFQIKRLEKELGVLLLERTKRRVFITQAGEIFLNYSREILSKWDEVKARLENFQKIISGEIHIATINSVGIYELPQYIQKFTQTYPAVNIRVSTQHPNAICDLVSSDEAEFGILPYPEGRLHLTVDPFLTDEMVIITSPQHRLRKMKTVKITVLHHENFIAFNRDLPTRRMTDSLLRSRQVSVNIQAEFDSIEMIKKSVEINQGISILPRLTVQEEVAQGKLHVLKLADVKFRRPLGIIYRKDKIFTKAMTLLLQLLKTEKI